MKGIVLGIVATAIAFAVLTLLVPQIKFGGGVAGLVLIAVIFGVVNGLIKPVIKLLSFPVNLMTMGLFGILVNVVLFMGTAFLTDQLAKVADFTIAGWPTHALTLEVIGTALIASIVLGLLTTVVGLVVKD